MDKKTITLKDINVKYIKWGIFFLLVFSLCFSVSKCSSYKRQYENSYREYNDTLSAYKNKYDEIYAMNNAYITDINTLKRENKELYDEVKSLKDNPIVVTKIKTEYITDTITVIPDMTTDTVTGDFLANIQYSDEWNMFDCTFNGNIYTGSSLFTMNRMQFNCSLTTDLIEKDGRLYFISKSDNPYLSITDMDGYLVSPEKSKVLKKIFNRPWGVMIGAGCTATIYDNRIMLMPGLNLTVGYKILSF